MFERIEGVEEENQTDGVKNDISVEQESAPATFGGLLSHFASRRDIIGAVLGAMAGSAPFLMARPAQAAPADLKGSPNIAVKMYQNKSGVFTLCSDARIWNMSTGAEAISGLSQYTVVTSGKFKTLSPVQGRVKGSPNVSVDVFVDTAGTYVLFADGSVRRPNGAAGSEGASQKVRVEYYLPTPGGATATIQTDGWTRVGAAGVTWNPAFSVAPILLNFTSGGGGGGGGNAVVLGTSGTANGMIGDAGFIAIGIG